MIKKSIIILCILLGMLLVSGAVIFAYFHPTHYLFNDRFIIGATLDEITVKYGKYNRVTGSIKDDVFTVEYLIHSDTPELLFDGIDDSLWYLIHFENKIAVSVELREGWIGG